MWPNSDFASPVGSFIEPVPPPGVDPLSGGCAIVRINPAWLPYIRGALSQLWLQSTWDTDEAGLALVTQQVTDLIFAFQDLEKGPCDGIFEPPIAESEIEMSLCEQLRFHNGQLQALCCGVWTDIDGQPTQGVSGGGQPGNGTPQPPAGGCQVISGVMGADRAWYLPIPVSSGDTIEIHNAHGIWNDGLELAWRSYNGNGSFAGIDTGKTALSGTDPLPTVPHMAMLAKIGASFYDISHGLFTVPGGISVAAVQFLVNDSNPSDNPGEVSFDVTVCNNQPEVWSKTWDFRTDPGPWNPLSDSLVTDGAVWTPGVGWSWTDQTLPGGSHERIAGIQLDPIAFNMDSLDFVFDRTMGTLDSTTTVGQNLVLNTSVVNTELWSSLVSGSGQHYFYPTPTAITTRIAAQMGCANNNTGPTFDGSVVITGATITGHGANPFA